MPLWTSILSALPLCTSFIDFFFFSFCTAFYLLFPLCTCRGPPPSLLHQHFIYFHPFAPMFYFLPLCTSILFTSTHWHHYSITLFPFAPAFYVLFPLCTSVVLMFCYYFYPLTSAFYLLFPSLHLSWLAFFSLPFGTGCRQNVQQLCQVSGALRCSPRIANITIFSLDLAKFNAC